MVGRGAEHDAVLAYDLGGTKVSAGLIDSRGKIICQETHLVPFERGKDGVFDFLVDLGGCFLERARCAGIGIASAGPMDLERGLLLNPTNMKTGGKGWGTVALVEELEKRFRDRGNSIPLTLENDAAAAVLAEAWIFGGEDLIALTLGTGLGVGILMNGKPLRARGGYHPEAGHIIVDVHAEENRDLERCGCGNVGCAETFLSGVHFSRRLGRILGREISGHDVIKLARSGDSRVLDQFKYYGKVLARVIRSFSVLFAPQRVVIGGGFSATSPFFLEACRMELQELMASRREGVDLLPEIEVSRLGSDAGLVGAARVAHLALKG